MYTYIINKLKVIMFMSAVEIELEKKNLLLWNVCAYIQITDNNKNTLYKYKYYIWTCFIFFGNFIVNNHKML